jgi:hypothetical protein
MYLFKFSPLTSIVAGISGNFFNFIVGMKKMKKIILDIVLRRCWNGKGATMVLDFGRDYLANSNQANTNNHCVLEN